MDRFSNVRTKNAVEEGESAVDKNKEYIKLF